MYHQKARGCGWLWMEMVQFIVQVLNNNKRRKWKKKTQKRKKKPVWGWDNLFSGGS